MSADSLESRAAQVRAFNRFYTRQIGLLRDRFLDSPFSLTEVRILYELAHREGLTASDLCRDLGFNAGYMSRVVSGFVRKGLVAKTRSAEDGRAVHLELTDKGRQIYGPLDAASQRDITALLEALPETDQRRLIAAMREIRGLLDEPDPSYLLRDPQPGDLGWIVSRQAELYAQEYGWNEEYEALVAEIAARYIREFKPGRERCWIAEKNGRRVGSVFVIQRDETTAQIRLLSVDPLARTCGIGTRLVDECLRFARQAGYRKMMLWTNSVLTGARRIYDRAGFRLVGEEPHHSFGKDLIGQTLELDL